jgi:hypothetical protein
MKTIKWIQPEWLLLSALVEADGWANSAQPQTISTTHTRQQLLSHHHMRPEKRLSQAPWLPESDVQNAKRGFATSK